MRNILVSLLLVTGIAATGMTHPQDIRIAVFNVQAAILSTEEAQAKRIEFASMPDIVAMRPRADGSVADIRQAEDEANLESAAWSEERRAEYNRQMDYFRAELEQQAKRLQDEERGIQQRIMQEMQERAAKACQEVVEAEGVSLVLHPDAVRYAEPSLDITQQVTDKLNER